MPIVSPGPLQARTYDYEGEAQCDANVEIFKSCIETAASQNDGFAAIKVHAAARGCAQCVPCSDDRSRQARIASAYHYGASTASESG